MASVITSLFGGGNVLDGAAKLVNAIRGKNPEDAAKLQELLTKHEDTVLQVNAELEKARIDENVKLNDIAGQNVRADAQSGDKFTSRARPAIIWVGLGMFVWNWCLVPTCLHKWGFQPVVFPDMFMEIWGIVAGGVVFTRTLDKFSSLLLGGAGGSAQLPFGIKVDSKGDGK